MAVREDLLDIVALRLMRRGRRRGDCLEYMGARVRNYGSMQIDGRSRLTHRLAWQAFIGPIPEGLNVLHRCDNPPCFNTDHLYLGTQSENMKDRHTRNPETTARGEKIRGKLTADDVRRMRDLYASGNFSTRSLQRAHFPWVSARTVAHVIKGDTWSHI